MSLKALRFEEKFAQIDDYWSPRIVGELNGQYIKIAKFLGEFVWHSHAAEDEFFQVIKGSFTLHRRDGSVTLNAGDCYIVPRGVEHKPEATEEAWVMMFEPKSTEHTGGTATDLTVEREQQAWL